MPTFNSYLQFLVNDRVLLCAVITKTTTTFFYAYSLINFTSLNNNKRIPKALKALSKDEDIAYIKFKVEDIQLLINLLFFRLLVDSVIT